MAIVQPGTAAVASLTRVATSARQLLCYSRTMDELEKVRNELKKYLHPLLDLSVRNNDGKIELVIDLKNRPPDIHTYYLEIHPRDLASSQFPWTLQRMIFDGLHDYFVEMFVYTPQSLDNPEAPR